MFPKTLPPLCGIQVCMKGRRTTICLFILAHFSRSNNKEWLEELGEGLHTLQQKLVI
jgi:hypothetical protein